MWCFNFSPNLGEIYIASHFTKLSPKAEDKDQACQRTAKNIFQTFIEKLLRVSNKNRTFVLKINKLKWN